MKRRFSITQAFLLAALCFLGACGTVGKVGTFKDLAAKGDYRKIAAERVVCAPSDEGCNQLHLIKGDACYRLAKQGVEPKAHYQCAVDELSKGLDQTREWRSNGLDLDRAQTYANLCESLANLQDMEKGEAATRLSQRLLATGQAFRATEPQGNVAAVYYINSARYALLQPGIIQSTDPAAACRALKTIQIELEEVAPGATGTPYQQNYRQLQLDIAKIRQTIDGCD
jgi:hypothetical protein